MRVVYGAILSLILIVTFVASYRKNKDVFSPLCIFSLFQFLRYVPHIMSCDYEHRTVLNSENVLATFLYEILFVLFVQVGYKLYIRNSGKINRGAIESRISSTTVNVPVSMIIFVYLIGLASRLYVISKLGGISQILHNMGSSYREYISINGYITSLGNLMTLSIIMFIDRYSQDRKHKILILGMITLSMLSYLIYSSRSPALELLMIAVFSYHYLVRRIRVKDFLKPKVLIIVLAVTLIICLLPALRNDSTHSNDINLAQLIESGANSVFDEFSYVGRDTYVYEHFNLSNFWLGRNFLNLFVGFIPSSVYHNKPCLDDGNYLNNLLYGYDISPNDPYTSLRIQTSVPFSTQGSMYANFGIIGVIIGGLIIGALYKKIYAKLKGNLSGISVIVYQLVVYQLELSTLSITQTLIPLLLILIVYYLCFKRQAKRRQEI